MGGKALQLQNKVAVITGASMGIGSAIALAFAKEGAAVAVDYRSHPDEAKELVEQVEGSGGRAISVHADVSSPEDVKNLIQKAVAEFGRLDVMVNNAGAITVSPLVEITTAEWDRVFNVNMRGTFFVTRRALPAMVAANVGRVVNVSSISAQRGGGTFSKTPYSASKAAVIGFTRAVAREMGPHHITVNCVAPGPIDTDIMGGTLTDERKAALSADIPLGRVGTVQEVAALLTFLMSEDAGWITAATYDINGGQQMS